MHLISLSLSSSLNSYSRSLHFLLVVVFVLICFPIYTETSFFWRQRRRNKNTSNNSKMGQAMRMIQYDQKMNERSAISALKLAEIPLNWFRLDDGVMGGQSETNHDFITDGSILHFQGIINTNGGGFASIRTKLPDHTLTNYSGIQLRVKGDGKTYKFFLTDGSRAGPMARKPSWQMDIPTINNTDTSNSNWQDVTISFDQLQPSFGGGPRNQPTDKTQYKFDASEMKEMGLMLSLKLSDGRPNPKETFGEGIFPFSLQLQSISPIVSLSSSSEK